MAIDRISDTELAELDLAVARAEGYLDAYIGQGVCWIPHKVTAKGLATGYRYQPTRDPAEAMRLIRKYKIDLQHDAGICRASAFYGFAGGQPDYVSEEGSDEMIAICQCVVALKAAEKPHD